METKKYYCEECGKYLFESNNTRGGAGVEARKRGFIYKIPFVYGINGSYFFCCKECWNKWFNNHTTEKDRKDGNEILQHVKEDFQKDLPKLQKDLQTLINAAKDGTLKKYIENERNKR